MWILVSLLLFAVSSCEFQYSPYVSKVSEIRSNDLNLVRIREQEPVAPTSFKIALISDTHNNYKELSQLVDEINSNGPYAFVLVSGDVTNIALLEEFEEALDRLRQLDFPFLVVPGNHDLVANGRKIFQSLFGDLDVSFEYHNALFILHNNNNWETHGISPSLPWVLEQSRGSSADFKVLVGHVPPQDTERFSAEFIDGWREMVDQELIDYVINGHNHGPAEGNFGDAVNITVGSAAARTYVEILISPGAIDHQRINL